MEPLPYPLTDYSTHAYGQKLAWRYGPNLSELSLEEADYELLKLVQQLPQDRALARLIEALAYWVFLNTA